jgi:hypothetical protein
VPTVRWILVALGAVLLVSMGGAIVAAPLLVPALVLAIRTSGSSAFRGAATTILVLTVGEVAWAVTYLAVEESQPAIWLVPVAVMAAVAATSSRWSGRDGLA